MLASDPRSVAELELGAGHHRQLSRLRGGPGGPAARWPPTLAVSGLHPEEVQRLGAPAPRAPPSGSAAGGTRPAFVPTCMSPEELAGWRAAAALVIREPGASPCADCTVRFSAVQAALGLCNGRPGARIGFKW